MKLHTETFLDLISAKIDRDRAKEAQGDQLTISEILYRLVKLDALLPVYLDYPTDNAVPSGFSCYRGFYSDLAIGIGTGKAPTRAGFETRLNAVIGSTYTGYKGGEFTMGPNTLVWVAQDCGDCSSIGVAGVAVVEDRIVLQTKVRRNHE